MLETCTEGIVNFKKEVWLETGTEESVVYISQLMLERQVRVVCRFNTGDNAIYRHRGKMMFCKGGNARDRHRGTSAFYKGDNVWDRHRGVSIINRIDIAKDRHGRESRFYN